MSKDDELVERRLEVKIDGYRFSLILTGNAEALVDVDLLRFEQVLHDVWRRLIDRHAYYREVAELLSVYKYYLPPQVHGEFIERIQRIEGWRQLRDTPTPQSTRGSQD